MTEPDVPEIDSPIVEDFDAVHARLVRRIRHQLRIDRLREEANKLDLELDHLDELQLPTDAALDAILAGAEERWIICSQPADKTWQILRVWRSETTGRPRAKLVESVKITSIQQWPPNMRARPEVGGPPQG